MPACQISRRESLFVRAQLGAAAFVNNIDVVVYGEFEAKFSEAK